MQQPYSMKKGLLREGLLGWAGAIHHGKDVC